jgi:hypothetical protein
MPILVATAGATNANSYATMAEADTYFDERLQATNWIGEKARALIMATRRIDVLRFEGEKVSTAQALKWPRIEAYDDDGEEYDTSTVPAIVKQATYELALKILNDDAASTDTLGVTGLESIRRAKVGPLEVEVYKGFKAADLPDTVLRLLRPVLASSGLMAELVRG